MKQKKLYGEICRNNLSPFNINSKYHIRYTLYVKIFYTVNQL